MANPWHDVPVFFEDYKALENKDVVVERFLESSKANEVLARAAALYQQQLDHLRLSEEP